MGKALAIAGIGLAAVVAAAGVIVGFGGKRREGMIHRRAFPAEVKGFDPVTAGDLYSGTAVLQIFEPLYEWHYLKRYELTPLTATALPETSEDGRTLTIRLRPGIRFHDDPCFPGDAGRELVAGDYIYSWKRVADPRSESPLWAFFQGAIEGLDAFREAAQAAESVDYDQPVAGLTAPDPHTLVIQLTKPSRLFPMFLAMPFTSAVPREAVERYGDGFLNHPVGTGAFRLDEWKRDSRFVLRRHAHYRDVRYPSEGQPPDRTYSGDEARGLLRLAGQRAPFCDWIEVSILTEDQPRWLEFVNGNLDVSAIPKDAFGQAIAGGRVSPDFAARGITLESTPDLDLVYMCFNMSDPVVGGEKNKLLRRAVARAIDETKLRELFYNDRGVLAQSMIPPGLFGYDPDYRSPSQYDPARAKALLAEAGYPDGAGLSELVYDMTGSDTTTRNMGEFLKGSLAQVGIKLRLVSNTWPAFDEKTNKGQLQMFGAGWGADYPDPENFLQLLYGPNSAPNGQNAARFQDPEYDRLYEQVRALPNGPERLAAVRRMVDIAAEQQPLVYEVHRDAWVLSHPWCPNYKYPQVGGGYWKYIHVDMADRARRLGP